MKSDLTIMKIKVSPKIAEQLINKQIIIVLDKKSQTELTSLPLNKKMFCEVKHGGKHNLDRHDLFWACVAIVSSNLGLTDRQVVETCKIDTRWYEGFTHYKDKDGKDRVNVMTKSIRFSELTLAEANEFYSKAFDVIAGYIGVTTEKLTEEAKGKMRRYI